MQDAFVRAAERWPRDGAPRNPGAWIVTTARNSAIDRILIAGRAEECVLHRVLGEVEITEDAAEDRNGLRAFVAVGAGEVVYATVS